MYGPVAPDLARHTANRIRQATLAYLNTRVEPGLSAFCYGGGADATRRGPIAGRSSSASARSSATAAGPGWPSRHRQVFGAIPHGSLLAALRLPRTNVFLSGFDRTLERACIVFLRYLDDVTILDASPEALDTGLNTVLDLLESLGMSLRAEKTQAVWLNGSEPPASGLELPGRGHELPVAGKIDFLGIHFLGREQCRARETTVNRLLRKIHKAIVAGRGNRPRQRHFRSCRRINELFGYELTGPPARCRIGKVRYVQPHQHAALGHSELILEPMWRADRTVQRWRKPGTWPGARKESGAFTPPWPANTVDRRVTERVRSPDVPDRG